MTVVHGFELLREQHITEINTLVRFYRHANTGAQLLSLINDDENKVFGITFRTPPSDSTGVAHILEHSVLCGSRKYPVKEPFVELLKGSLKTFLNAFTYPDKTCYPVASQNVQDFYNLIDVYLDAVFHPRITPMILQQEGWHLDLESPDAPLAYKGVVYNEMKGAYSSPDTLLAEYSQQAVFPDNTYGFDSGGEPKVIPNLNYEQFKSFHEKHYHPSNARIYFYGDDDPARRLHLLNDYLKEFSRLEIDSRVHPQSRFDKPKRVVRAFAASEEDSANADRVPKGMVTLNWLMEETLDPELNLGLHILEYILLGMPGSPLRKTLIESGLGEDIAGVGLEAELRQMYFSTGLKGIEPEKADRVQELILQTLSALAKDGIDPLTVEAAMNTVEFRLRENNTGSFPRGLVLMLRALTTWLYEGDPVSLLAFDAPLAVIKSRIEVKERYFEDLINRFCVENPHRITLIMQPDPDLARRQEAEEREQMRILREAMDATQLQAVIEATHKLQEAQQAPDPPEALASIPALKLEDLDRENKTIPLTLAQHRGARVLYHDLFTNGIVYLNLGFNLHLLPQKYLPYVPLLGRAFIELGTETEDFVAFTQRISRKTGGIHPKYFTSVIKDSKDGAAWLFLCGKAMMAQTGELLKIFRDMLLTMQLDNRERFRQMVLEEKARQEQKMVPNGHQVVNLRLRSHFSEADWAAEQMNGVSYLLFVRELARQVDADWNGVLGTLQEMRQILVNRDAMVCNVTLDASNWLQFEPRAMEFIGRLPANAAAAAASCVWSPELPPAFEGMLIPAQVNYVGKGANLYRHGYRYHGSALVITRYLRNSWLWERIRVQGGAYGSFCLLDRLSGTLTFVSYRDPNFLKTLENFDRTVDFLHTVTLNDDELAKSIIGAIGDIDAYMLPDAKGYVSMLRHLTGDSDAARQQMRNEVLATTVADFRAFADTLEIVRQQGLVKILGAQSAIEESLTDRPDWLKLLKVL